MLYALTIRDMSWNSCSYWLLYVQQ